MKNKEENAAFLRLERKANNLLVCLKKQKAKTAAYVLAQILLDVYERGIETGRTQRS